MARVSAAGLRDRARDAVIAAGGRGFVRFAPPGGALLITDALRRCTDAAQVKKLIDALEEAGFACRQRDGLLWLTPQDDLLRCEADEYPAADWQLPLYELAALAVRWASVQPQEFTPAGRRLMLETLRLLWQPRDKVLAGMNALRAQAAAMLREGDRSGLHEAGWILYDWCREGLA